MRLTLLIPTLDRSGAEKQFTLLARGLRERTDWELEAVALTRGGPYQDVLERNGIRVTVLGKRFKFDPVCLWRLKRLLRERPPDVLHSWMFTANTYARLAAGKRPPFSVVVSERCVDSWKRRWQTRIDRWLIERTDCLLTNSTPVAEFYHELGYPPRMTRVIPNGVEVRNSDDLFPGNQLREELRAEWEIPYDARVVGYVGRLAPQKRVKDLIWAFHLLRHLTDNVYFVVVGDGPQRRDLEHYAARSGCDARVRFVGHRDEGAEVMRTFDLFWLASEFEGMSNSLMEAMATGIPCIASEIPANQELIVPGQTGDLFPVGDSLALAQLSDRLLHDDQRYRAISEQARTTMRAGFSVERMVERHLDLYSSLLDSPRPAKND
jgi:glycosyltransferase involved in cell wall biosynthesis